ncbi:MAG: phosphotransferase [Deltaproteobacteria bacterium]|nr:phosphotransferase [Deltaproteobacteria bacterium]
MDLGPLLEALYGRRVEHCVESVGSTIGRGRGDASSRSYARVRIRDAGVAPQTSVVMQLPNDPLRSDEGGGRERTRELAFVNVQRCMKARGVPVPDVLLDASRSHGKVLLQDLGDTTLEKRLGSIPAGGWAPEYDAAVDLLAELHDRMAQPDPACVAYGRHFDRALLRWELDHYREWGLEARLGITLASELRTRLDGAFDRLVDRLASLPMGFVHRDYQSRNLMIHDGALWVIDFQDALMGPRIYDLVALLCDSYVDVAPALREREIERYAARRGLERGAVAAELHLVALHRKLKDSGRFVFIDRVKKNPDFLPHVPQSLEYVRRALRLATDVGDLREALAEAAPGDFGSVV